MDLYCNCWHAVQNIYVFWVSVSSDVSVSRIYALNAAAKIIAHNSSIQSEWTIEFFVSKYFIFSVSNAWFRWFCFGCHWYVLLFRSYLSRPSLVFHHFSVFDECVSSSCVLLSRGPKSGIRTNTLVRCHAIHLHCPLCWCYSQNCGYTFRMYIFVSWKVA